MDELKGEALETHLIQQWKEIEELEGGEAEDLFRSKKEQWFVQAFSFLRDLPEESHCWCGHKEIMLPLLEPFYNYFKQTASNSSLRVLWGRLTKELRGCTRCVVQHHKAKEFYLSEFVEELVTPLMGVIRALDEERVAKQMKDLVLKFTTDTLDPKEDSYGVICIMFEVFMFPFLLEDAEIIETLKPFLLHVEQTHDLTLAAGQRYPGVYSLLLHTDQGVRRIALKLAHSLPTFKDEVDMESIQPMLQKCMHCLEYDAFHSSTQGTEKVVPPVFASHGRPRAVFAKDALWRGLATILSLLEPPAFLKGVMEKYPVFVSLVLNHVSEATSVFWNALRCLKLLLEVLGYKLWLGTTFSPGVMRNTLLSQCFHSHEERMHVHIFDLFQPFLQSLEALQDGEFENQRRRLLYFLLQQVPMSNNFKPLMTKKARQIAFSIIGRGYTMDPPLPPVECVHVWGPPLVATLKDTGLIKSLTQSAVDLIQSIIVGDASALGAVSTQQACLQNSGKYSLDPNDDDIDMPFDGAMTDGKSEVVGDFKYWVSFLSVTKAVEVCEQWFCLPVLWIEVLNGIMPMHLPVSFTKAIMWALARLSLIDLEGMPFPQSLVGNSDGVTCSKGLLPAFKWVKPKGCDDGAGGEGCVNAVKTNTHHKELIAFLKKYAEKYINHFRDCGNEQGSWVWEASMAEPCFLLLLDANATFRDFGKEILRRTGNATTLEAGLEVLCSSEASSAAVARGLQYAVKLLLQWPLTRCSRGLQQLFFHVWKFLTIGDRNTERLTSLSQLSQDGGFLSQPKFQNLNLNNSVVTPPNAFQKDGEVLRKLCKLVAFHLWPLLEKTILEGRQHVEGAGQLMTFTRMLQLLPCVFQNLNAVQKKQIFLGSGGRSSMTGGDTTDVIWFQEFVNWVDIPSPIIQRWWKEAVVSILEDLKGWDFFLSSEMEDMIVDLQKPGQQLDESHRVRLSTHLHSVFTSVRDHKFLDKEVDAMVSENENSQGPKFQLPGDQGNIFVPDSTDKVNSEYMDIIDLTDDSDLIYSQPPKLSGLYHNRGDKVQPVQKQPLINDIEASHSLHSKLPDIESGSTIHSADKGHHEGQKEPQFRRPSVRQAPVSSGNKSATLDNFLLKFRNEQAKKEANKGGSQVQGRMNTFKQPVAKSKPQKSGSKLSSLRNEHRVNLEQRNAVEGLVRNQVRERVEREANAKQSPVVEVRSDDTSYLQVPAADFVPVATSGTDPEPKTKPSLDAILREMVTDNEGDPLDAAFENVRKTLTIGLKDRVLQPKRKVITLEMPGESGRGGFGKTQASLVIKARQVPRLDDWYKRILSLDYLSVVGISHENTSRGSNVEDQLEKVPLTFKSPEEYMQIFRPLVLEEFKSQLQRSHEELHLSDGTTTGILRLMSMERVDEFQVGRFMAEAGSDGAARACADNELLLLSRQPLQSQAQSCHLLAKVESRDRESKSRATVLLLKLYIQSGDARLTKAKRLLVDRSKWYVTRLMNITPQLRECQALSSLSSLPLLPILLSPGSSHQVKTLENISSFVNLKSVAEPLENKLRADYNESQLGAISAAIGGKETMTNDHQLTLVQGPPGTGKTKTIVAILSVLLAVRSAKRNFKMSKENESPLPRSSVRNPSIKSSSRDAAAMSRMWQDAARAKELVKESQSQSHAHDFQGQKQRVLVCAQSNAAVDEIVARICKNGLYGENGSFFRPSIVRVGTLKSVHPNSLPVFIDTLVEQRVGSEKGSESDALDDKEQTQLAAHRVKLEEVIEFIQVIEALRSQSEGTEVADKGGQKTEPSESGFGTQAAKIVAQGDAAVTAKLNLLYRQRRELTAALANAEKEGKKAYEEKKNKRKAIRKDIIREANVVVTTLSGCGGDIYTVCMEALAGGKKNKSVQDCFFDAVIIDEAAQALEPATLIPFQLLAQTNARCVMVGDPKQLPATVLSQMASKMQYECSMFERLQRAGYPVIMLRTQYRMHPEIREFPSSHFYDNLITDGEGLKAERKAIFHKEPNFGPYVFFNVVDGQESRKASQSVSNESEVEVALQVYLTLKTRYPAELWEGRVGVITPYKQQLGLLREQFVKTVGPTAASDIEFNTVDGFQGREVDILILSTVRASSSASSKLGDIGFVADVRRMNVALTRARFSMWIIGNAATLQANSSWASLLSNAKKRSLIFNVKKPYTDFFKKKSLVHSSPAGDLSVLDSTEAEVISKNTKDDERFSPEVGKGRPRATGRDVCFPDSAGKGDPWKGVGSTTGEEVSAVRRHVKKVPCTDVREELKGRSSAKDGRATEVRDQKDHRSNERLNNRNGEWSKAFRNVGEDLRSKFFIEDGESSQMREPDDHSRQSPTVTYEERSKTVTKRYHTELDRVSMEGLSSERLMEEKSEKRLHQHGYSDMRQRYEGSSRSETPRHDSGKERMRVEGISSGKRAESRSHVLPQHRSSGSEQRYEERGRAERNRHFSGKIVEGRSPETLHSESDTQGVRFEGNSKAEHSRQHPKHYTTLDKARSEDRLCQDRNSVDKHRYDDRFHTTDHKNMSEPGSGEQKEGKLRMCLVDGRNLKRSGVSTKDHRLDPEESDGIQNSTSRKVNVPTILSDGNERRGQGKHGRSPLEQEQILVSTQKVRENTLPNVVGTLQNGRQAVHTELLPRVKHPSSLNLRTTKDDLAAARKRQREEAAALLPSGLLQSSTKRPASAAQTEQLSHVKHRAQPVPLRRVTNSTGQASTPSILPNGLDMNNEWIEFEKVLGKAKSSGSIVSPRGDAPLRDPMMSSHKPLRDSERLSSGGPKPLSDLDNILSGLPSVTWAQAKGSKPKEQGSGSKHF